jgi:ADP-ribose pyrophosphatase
MSHSNTQKSREERALVEGEILYKGKIIELFKERITYEDGALHHWEIVRHPGAVVILPVDEKENVYLVKQWRRPIGKIILEIPAGTLEAGEPPLECAKREIQEEIGYRADKWSSLGGFYSAPGFCNEYLHFFLAESLSESSLEGDEHEAIDVVKMPIEEALALVDNREIEDLKTLYALLAYRRMEEM